MRAWWRGLDNALRVTLIVALITVLGGGAFTLAAAAIQKPDPVEPTPTTPSVVVTTDSPTPEPTPTTTSTSTPTPTTAEPTTPQTTPPPPTTDPNPYVATQQTLVLKDPLTKSDSKWGNDNSGTGTCAFKSDGMHVGANNYFHECYGRTSVRDFTLEVEFSFSTAKVAGVFFRQSGSGSWYFAGVGRISGNVWISKGVDGQAVDPELFIKEQTPLDASTWHKLAVTGIGKTLTVYVDGKKVGSGTDAQFTNGPIGLYTDGGRADGSGPAAETIFRNARVWR